MNYYFKGPKPLLRASMIAVLVAGATGLLPADVASAQARPAMVRDVDAPALTPFRTGVTFSITGVNSSRLLTTVPVGKRLVIEHISYWGFSSTGTTFVFAALRTGEFGPMRSILEIRPPHASATSSFTIQDASLPVKAYFEAGEQVWVTVSKSSGSGDASIEVTVQGHLVTP